MITAFLRQPFIEFFQGGKTTAFGKKTLSDHADLILHLAFLPAGGGGAGHQVKQIMGSQILEPAVEDPVLAQQHLADHRLQVVVNAPAADTTKKLEGTDMGIKHHFQGLTGIGNTEWFAAVAKAELGDLYSHRNPTQFDLFVTPVELEGITGGIFKRNVGFD